MCPLVTFPWHILCICTVSLTRGVGRDHAAGSGLHAALSCIPCRGHSSEVAGPLQPEFYSLFQEWFQLSPRT